MNDMPDAPPPTLPPPIVTDPEAFAAVASGWSNFTANVGAFIGVAVLPVVLIAVLVVVSLTAVHGVGLFLTAFALATLVSTPFFLGLFNAALMATAGQPVSVGTAFTTDRWGAWIGFSLSFGLLLAVGMIPCGIGALLVVAFFGLAPFYVLDERKGVADAFRASWDATRSRPGLPFALALTGVVGYLGVILGFVFALVTFPIAIAAAATLYRNVTGEPVSE